MCIHFLSFTQEKTPSASICYQIWKTLLSIYVAYKCFPHLYFFFSSGYTFTFLGAWHSSLSGSAEEIQNIIRNILLYHLHMYIIQSVLSVCVYIKYIEKNIYLKRSGCYSQWLNWSETNQINMNRIELHTNRNTVIHCQWSESCTGVKNQRQSSVQELQLTNRYIYSHI